MRFAAALVAAGCAMGAASGVASAQDSIPASPTGGRGDPAGGRATVTNRQLGLCLLCHSGPFPEERFQGNLAPDLVRRKQFAPLVSIHKGFYDSVPIQSVTSEKKVVDVKKYYQTDRLRPFYAFDGAPLFIMTSD